MYLCGVREGVKMKETAKQQQKTNNFKLASYGHI